MFDTFVSVCVSVCLLVCVCVLFSSFAYDLNMSFCRVGSGLLFPLLGLVAYACFLFVCLFGFFFFFFCKKSVHDSDTKKNLC